MTITESELREILNGDGDGGEGRNRGVTVAGVHRRIREIRRRRRWTAGGAAAAALAVAVALNTPAGGVTDDLDVWTGVMARPSPTVPTTSQPLGGPYPGDEVANGSYRTGGTREELRIGSGSKPLTVSVHCSGPMRRAVVWIGDNPPQLHLCGTAPGGHTRQIYRGTSGVNVIPGEIPLTRGQAVSAVVLPGEVEEKAVFEGWEEQLAAARPFPLKWSLSVREMVHSVCRDNVRQVDPRTGEMVRLSCEGKDTAPPG
ncbi:hypothetical protein AB0G15_03970 [Streptosporangium sp. NPDC023825]|uniref:hypothetical protein n=1 Tax=Streptosporangium sp. NPDC023825 TaxID=3154909 RepID=UPI0034357940